jgi:hypothetical protein
LLAAKRGAFLKGLIPNKTSPIFSLRPRLNFLWAVLISLHFSCFVRRDVSASSTSRSAKIPKTEPLSPIAGASHFAYASDIAENNVCKLGHVIELSF